MVARVIAQNIAEPLGQKVVVDSRGHIQQEIARVEPQSGQDLVSTIDRLRPGAAGLISVGGPKVPVAYRMDDSQLRAKVPGIPKTPLEEGIRKTIDHFEQSL